MTDGAIRQPARAEPDPARAAFEPVHILNAGGDPQVLLVCDHASNATPPEYGTLGLKETDFRRHIAYDIGAAEVTRHLSVRLNAPAVLANFSRLLIDPNRAPDDPTLVMKISDRILIPSNRHVDAEERERRLARFYRPYDRAIAARIAAARAQGVVPALIAIHSFTPIFKGIERPWHIGILWSRDPRLAVPLLANLSAMPDLVVGDNEPYSGELEGDTMDRHGNRNGLPHVLIEIRQDLIDTAHGAAAWAERLGQVLAEVLADEAVRRPLPS